MTSLFSSKSIRVMLVFSTIGVLSGCSSPEESLSSTPTRADYFQAAQAAAQCVRDKGFGADEPNEVFNMYQIPVESNGDGSNEDAVAALDQCWSKHALNIENEYFKTLALSGAEWEADYKVMLQCLEGQGITGLEVGDPEGDVGLAIQKAGNDIEAINCLQGHLDALFRNQD